MEVYGQASKPYMMSEHSLWFSHRVFRQEENSEISSHTCVLERRAVQWFVWDNRPQTSDPALAACSWLSTQWIMAPAPTIERLNVVSDVLSLSKTRLDTALNSQLFICCHGILFIGLKCRNLLILILSRTSLGHLFSCLTEEKVFSRWILQAWLMNSLVDSRLVFSMWEITNHNNHALITFWGRKKNLQAK